MDGAEAYNWVKYVFIDDPVSSLDDNNAIAVASDLSQLLINQLLILLHEINNTKINNTQINNTKINNNQ